MEEIAPPEREKKYWQCRCEYVLKDMPQTRNRCMEDTGSPDVPFCKECESRHPKFENNPLIGVTAVVPELERKRS